MKRLTQNVVMIILAGGFILASGTAFYFYQQYRHNLTSTKTPGDTAEIVAEVGRLMALPEDERPLIATVQNLEQVADMPFFAKAKVGDRVLMYVKARKAILYDQVAGKILEVAPLK